KRAHKAFESAEVFNRGVAANIGEPGRPAGVCQAIETAERGVECKRVAVPDAAFVQGEREPFRKIRELSVELLQRAYKCPNVRLCSAVANVDSVRDAVRTTKCPGNAANDHKLDSMRCQHSKNCGWVEVVIWKHH